VSFFLAVAVAGAVVALDRLVGPVPLAKGTTPPEVSGAWYCPHGGGDGWSAWIAVANPSDDPAALRVSTMGGGSRPVETPAEIQAKTTAYVEVPAEEASAASTVEFLGAPVAVGMVVSLPEQEGLAADPCVPEPSREWFVPGGTTLRGQRARLVVMNPFATDAAVEITLTGTRGVIRPGALQGLVLPSRRSVSIELNRFALGEEAVVARVRATLGRVVAGGLGSSQRGLRSAIGVPAPARAWVLPGAGDDGLSALQVMVPGSREAPFRVRAQRVDGQTPLLDEASGDGGFAEALELEAEGAGLIVEAAGRQPFVVARRTGSREADDSALTAGTLPVAGASLALPATKPGGGGARLVIENPGAGAARGRVTLFSDTGPVVAPALANVDLGPGRIMIVDLSALAGLRPVAAFVEVTDGTLVSAQVSISSDGYAVSVGIPLEDVPGFGMEPVS
jgi:hypothetical protein